VKAGIGCRQAFAALSVEIKLRTLHIRTSYAQLA
jgi:hypothetical protein